MPLICQSVVEHINALCVVYISYDTHQGLLMYVGHFADRRHRPKCPVCDEDHCDERLYPFTLENADASESIRVRRGYALKKTNMRGRGVLLKPAKIMFHVVHHQ